MWSAGCILGRCRAPAGGQLEAAETKRASAVRSTRLGVDQARSPRYQSMVAVAAGSAEADGGSGIPLALFPVVAGCGDGVGGAGIGTGPVCVSDAGTDALSSLNNDSMPGQSPVDPLSTRLSDTVMTRGEDEEDPLDDCPSLLGSEGMQLATVLRVVGIPASL